MRITQYEMSVVNSKGDGYNLVVPPGGDAHTMAAITICLQKSKEERLNYQVLQCEKKTGNAGNGVQSSMVSKGFPMYFQYEFTFI